MLRWRLILGPLLIALLLALCWLDAQATRPGIWLVPLGIAVSLLATQELLAFFRAGSFAPRSGSTYVGTLLPVLAACAPIAWLQYPADCPVGRLGWLAGGLAAGLLVVLCGEMRLYGEMRQQDAPGQHLAKLAAAAFAILYVGGLLGFMVQLRLLPVGGESSRGGMLAMLSMIVVVKATDIGAFTAGHLWGRHKLAPKLSPGKTWEGAIGGLAFAVVWAWLTLGPIAGRCGIESTLSGASWGLAVVGYGLVVGGAGVVGDLAESLLKRDAGRKDSSTWLPGFGGVLDLMDSLLVAAPVAYGYWVSGLLGY